MTPSSDWTTELASTTSVVGESVDDGVGYRGEEKRRREERQMGEGGKIHGRIVDVNKPEMQM